MLLVLASYEVGTMAYRRFTAPEDFPTYSGIGLLILFLTMVINLGVAWANTEFWVLGRERPETADPHVTKNSIIK